jgi:hypothetical protein
LRGGSVRLLRERFCFAEGVRPPPRGAASASWEGAPALPGDSIRLPRGSSCSRGGGARPRGAGSTSRKGVPAPEGGRRLSAERGLRPCGSGAVFRGGRCPPSKWGTLLPSDRRTACPPRGQGSPLEGEFLVLRGRRLSAERASALREGWAPAARGRKCPASEWGSVGLPTGEAPALPGGSVRFPRGRVPVREGAPVNRGGASALREGGARLPRGSFCLPRGKPLPRVDGSPRLPRGGSLCPLGTPLPPEGVGSPCLPRRKAPASPAERPPGAPVTPPAGPSTPAAPVVRPLPVAEGARP